MSLLEARHIHVCYGAIKALHGVSLHVATGEIVALIGANGSGKSTFLKAASGLLPCLRGEFYFNGHSLKGRAAHVIASEGLVQIPEGRHLFPRLTVHENMMLGAYARHDRAAIRHDQERLYELFPVLRERSWQPAGTLSGGEQQMLATARALMSRPRLLMLDEPSMGLAPRIVEKVFETIREINRQGVTILLVEQNANAALAVAQRGYVLETGAIALEGFTADLLKDDRVRCTYLGVKSDGS